MFELFDTKTRNLIGFFDSEADAVRFARRWPREAWDRLVLGAEDADGTYHVLLRGDDLLARLRPLHLVESSATAAGLVVYEVPDGYPVPWLVGAVRAAATQAFQLVTQDSSSQTPIRTWRLPSMDTVATA